MQEKEKKEWDIYFLKLAREVGKNSKCLSRKIGAVLVRDNVLVCGGYNGPPRGVPHCNSVDGYFMWKENTCWKNSCPRKESGYKSGEGLEFCPAAHAERNAILNAARLGISTLGMTIYCHCGPPCAECMKEIINAGITRLVCMNAEYYDDMSFYLINHSGMTFRQYVEGYLKEDTPDHFKQLAKEKYDYEQTVGAYGDTINISQRVIDMIDPTEGWKNYK